MRRHWLTLALFGIAAAPAAAPPASFPVGRFVEWPVARGSGVVVTPGLRARVDWKACGDGRPVSEGCAPEDHYLVVTIDGPGGPVVMAGAAGVSAYVGVGRLGHDARPSVMLATESGGSAGCVSFVLASPGPDGTRVARVRRESGGDTFCGIDDKIVWPRDLTDHGRAEFVFADERFQCQFTSCAASWVPARVFALEGSRVVDVSGDRALTPLFRADMVKARDACRRRTQEAEGACAGYAADAARLGELPEAWAVIRAEIARGCRYREGDTCLQRLTPAFAARLARFLHDTGYD